MNKIALMLIFGLAWCTTCQGQEQLRRDGVVVSYSGVSQPYAEAIAKTVSSARALAMEKFQFEMPDTIFVEVVADPSGKVRLFNDGQDRFSLTVRDEKDLAQPRRSGVSHIYGLCHEVGHLAMYRPIRDHSWLSYDAAEGWAHYLGSRLVDGVHEQLGPDLWPDKYDYLRDGTRRLQAQLDSSTTSPIAKCAGLWKEMTELTGDENVADIFADWGKTKVDPTEPGSALKTVLQNAAQGQQLAQWWDQAEESLVVKRPKSGFVAETVPSDRLDGEPRELFHDDGKQAGKNSSAGGGHAVQFESGPGTPAYLTSVQIYGSRYGRPAAPKEDFHVWLCDEDFKQVAEFKYPYSKFKRGQPKWVTLETDATKVPSKFIVCVGFNPTATKGVYMGYDKEASGNSLSGLPGRAPRKFSRGDWMIRVSLENAKHDYAFQPEADSGEGPLAQARTWKDSTGKFSLVAEFVGFENGQVKLKKTDGELITLPLEKLSRADQDFVKNK